MPTTNTLKWDKGPESDLVKYNIYRRVGSAPIKDIANTYLLSSVANTVPIPTYIDTVTSDGDYFYGVTAVDLSNNESGLSNIKDKLVDSVPPAPPTGLTVV